MTLSLTTLISYTLIYLPYYINFIKTFGTESLNTPVVFMQDFANIGSTISVNSMIFYYGGSAYSGGCLGYDGGCYAFSSIKE